MTRPLRMVFLLRRNPVSGSGAEASLRRISSGFPEAEVQVVYAGATIEGHRIAGKSGPGWWRFLRYRDSVEAALAKVRPDVTISFERGPRCDVFRAGGGVHAVWQEIRRQQRGRRSLNPLHALLPGLERRSVQSAKVVVANSAMVADEICEHHGIARERIRVIHNGFEPELFYPGTADRPEAMTAAGRHFVFVGNGWERKGLTEAMRLLAQRQKRDPSVVANLHILGSDDPQPFRKFAVRLGIAAQIHFHGSRSDVPAWLRAADAMILPTLYDPFTNAVLEALACGCPCVTTERNGAKEVLRHGETGFILSGDNEEAALDFLEHPPRDRTAIAASVSHRTAEAEAEAFRVVIEEVRGTREATLS